MVAQKRSESKREMNHEMLNWNFQMHYLFLPSNVMEQFVAIRLSVWRSPEDNRPNVQSMKRNADSCEAMHAQNVESWIGKLITRRGSRIHTES